MPAAVAAARAARLARRATPIAMEAYRRWQNLSPEERERYKQRARDYAARGRRAYANAQQQRVSGGGRRGRRR